MRIITLIVIEVIEQVAFNAKSIPIGVSALYMSHIVRNQSLCNDMKDMRKLHSLACLPTCNISLATDYNVLAPYLLCIPNSLQRIALPYHENNLYIAL